MGGAAAGWVLRPDLEIIAAESVAGRPAILVHDPQSDTYDRVEWPESDLVSLLRWPRTGPELRAAVTRITTLRPTPADIGSYLAELGRRGWLRGDRFWPTHFRERPRNGIMALAARILFFQVPLIRPERFLQATAGAVRLLVNPVTVAILFLIGIAALYLALPRWEEYWQDSLGSFRYGRLPAFFLALAAVKVVHEFAHAYAATLAGARVAAMGVAFFFLLPLPFTDVTDAWRLSWKRRLRVAAAGMLAEMALAGVALFLWALSPPGAAAMALAKLSSVAVVSTLLTNLNPGPRFDGYYVFMCLVRVENLRSRGMAALRRLAWGRILGLDLPDDTSGPDGARRTAMLLYAVYAVLYRLSLGCALGYSAYRFLPKAFGLPVAALVVWLFVGQPIVGESVRLGKSLPSMSVTATGVVLLLFLGALGVWVVGSWPRRLTFPAVSRATAEEAVRARRSGV
ncbi:MAG: M50 family metallopeptidase, partial [Planctomycetes bacterium]|nr:M50 family metallopeptidase [Planctomycetota bacterium]